MALIVLIFQGVMALPVMAGGIVFNPKEINLDSPGVEEVCMLDGSRGKKNKLEQIRIVRVVSPLWRLELPNEHLPALSAEYSVTGTNGKPNVFSNDNDPSSSIRVEIKPKGVKSEEYINNKWLMSEGLEIIIYPVTATTHGAYSGIIKTIISFSHI